MKTKILFFRHTEQQYICRGDLYLNYTVPTVKHGSGVLYCGAVLQQQNWCFKEIKWNNEERESLKKNKDGSHRFGSWAQLTVEDNGIMRQNTHQIWRMNS